MKKKYVKEKEKTEKKNKKKLISKKINIQEERSQLMSEVFDLYDPDKLGYVFTKQALKLLASMGRKIDKEDELEFLSIVDLKKKKEELLKKMFLAGVDTMFTIPDNFIPKFTDIFKVIDRNTDGKISHKEFN